MKSIGHDVIGMIKRTPKMTFGYEGKKRNLKEIYSMNRKRRGRSRYLLSVTVDVMANGQTIPAKVVYVRNKSNRKDYLCLISTDTELPEEEVIRLYGKRWDIEVDRLQYSGQFLCAKFELRRCIGMMNWQTQICLPLHARIFIPLMGSIN